MKIVVLDGYALNPGDNPWTPLEGLGELCVYDRTPPELTVERARGAAAVLTNKTPIGPRELDALPQLRYVGVLATGYNVVDTAAAAARGIPVTNVPTYGTDSVAEHTLALMLELCRRVGEHHAFVSAGGWQAAEDYSVHVTPQIELCGKTLGILGLGRIGRRVAALGQCLGMRVLACTPHPDREPMAGVEYCDLQQLCRRSDFLSLHCPATADTVGTVNAAFIENMKPTAFLINTSRGQLVDEQALADALARGRIAGAALDVLADEPPKRSPLIGAERVLITPHIAWATLDARRRLMQTAADNLRAFLQGESLNRVN